MVQKKLIKSIAKAALTVVAFAIVFSNINLQKVLQTIALANPLWLILAFVAFNFSKMLSSVRLNKYFKVLSINLKEWHNLLLYYIGMFYNLFLPGGIGGDGYKIYLLKKKFGASVKSLVIATFLDRISGLVPLLVLMGIFFLLADITVFPKIVDTFVLISTCLIIPTFYLFSFYLYPNFHKVFFSTLLMGFAVQVFQVVSIFFIFKSLGVNSQTLLFLLLFLISSVMAVLPLTIGGAGMRELVFLYGTDMFGLESQIGIAAALLFFIITAISSIIGGVLPNPLQESKIL